MPWRTYFQVPALFLVDKQTDSCGRRTPEAKGSLRSPVFSISIESFFLAGTIWRDDLDEPDFVSGRP